MNKSLRLEYAISYKRLLAFLFDLLSAAILTVALFFLGLLCIGEPAFKYSSSKKEMKAIENSYSLNLGSGKSYTEYEAALQHFYLESFPEEIKRDVNKNYGTDYSIVHIYNVVVLQLPDKPTVDNYQTGYYQYKMNDDGVFLVDELALRIEGKSGKQYEKNMRDLFMNTYTNLKPMLSDYDSHYKKLSNNVDYSYVISRMIGVSISVLGIFVIYPLINKYGSTPFERVYKIAHVNSKSGYLAPKYKLILRAIILFALPIFGLWVFNQYSIILITVFWLFINVLLTIFTSRNRDVPDFILRMDSANIENSLLFKNRHEEIEYESQDDFKEITDVDYVNKLEETKAIDDKKQE